MSFMKFKRLHLAIDGAETLFGLEVAGLLYWGLTYDLSGSISHLHLSNSHAPRCVVLSADVPAPGQLCTGGTSNGHTGLRCELIFGVNTSTDCRGKTMILTPAIRYVCVSF